MRLTRRSGQDKSLVNFTGVALVSVALLMLAMCHERACYIVKSCDVFCESLQIYHGMVKVTSPEVFI